MAGAVAPPKTPKTTVSTDPLFTQAVAQAQAALAAQQAPVKSEQAASDAYYQQRATDATANASAVADLLKGINPQGAYTTAAQNDSLLGGAFSQGFKDAVQGNTDNLNALLAKVGQPPIDSHATEAADVLNGLGGYIPGKSLDAQGAAYGAAFDRLPGYALLRGQENAQQQRMQGGKDHASFDAKLQDLAGKLPGDVQDNYAKLRQLALEDKRFALEVQNHKLSVAKYNTGIDEFNARQKLAVAKYNTGIDEFNVRQTFAYKKLTVQENQFAQRQVNSDRNYQLAMSRLGISQKRLQLSIAGNAFKAAHGGYTASQLARFNSKLDAIVAGSGGLTRPVNGVMPTPQYQDSNGKWHDITPNSVIPTNAKTRGTNTYANFLKAGLKKGVPIQMVIDRANQLFPETQRQIPQALQDLPAVAAAAAQQRADYSQMTGVTLGTAPNGMPVTWSAPKNLSSAGKKAVQGILGLAAEYLGTPYAWGGGGPSGPSRGTGRGANTVGFDCSSFAQFLYAKEGITIPRTTFDQYKTGLSVPRSHLQPGDLVFFQGSDGRDGLPGHVGIFIGNGKFVEAPHTGDVVKISSLSGYPGYMGARRYVH